MIEDLDHADWSAGLEGMDAVVHLAALAHQTGRRHKSLCAEMFRVNAQGTAALARAASGRVDRFVHVSSIGACRTTYHKPVTSGTPAAPEDDYGRSKLAGERAVRHELQDSDTVWCILRPPLVYGPSNPGNMARLLKLLRTRIPLPFAGIRNRRSLMYIENLVSAIETALSHEAVARRTFVLADDEVVSTPDLLRRIGAASQITVRLFPVPGSVLWGLGKVGDAISTIARRPVPFDSYSVFRITASLEVDDSEFREATGWRPAFTLQQGIAATFASSSHPHRTTCLS
jgi:nucleoside-diphosphate-sugar epimerase